MGSGMWSLSIALVALVLSSTAAAGLGGSLESVQVDQVHMKATVAISPREKYTVHEMRTPSGTIVREFASQSGMVFAVAWEGPSLPDLRQVLGPFFDRYTEAAKAKLGGHGSVTIQQRGLIVHSGGHMRAFFGRAYLPQVLPEGVTTAEIR
jgi:hypothetical protein